MNHLDQSPRQVADRVTSSSSSPTVQAVAARANTPLSDFLYEAQTIGVFGGQEKYLIPATGILAAAEEINRMRDLLETTKRGLTQSIRNLETIYGVIDKTNVKVIEDPSLTVNT